MIHFGLLTEDIFCNSLASAGPYACNGVPLRRVNQKYVIATSTSVSVAGVDVSKIDDAFFAREKKVVKKGEEALFDNTKKPTETSAARKAAQTAVDSALTKNIEKTPMLSAYLKVNIYFILSIRCIM